MKKSLLPCVVYLVLIFILVEETGKNEKKRLGGKSNEEFYEELYGLLFFSRSNHILITDEIKKEKIALKLFVL